jgi:GT2 family glycosyltransferase
MTQPQAPSVSIVIPNLDSPTIGRVLNAVRNQVGVLSPYEVLVVGRDRPGQVRAGGTVRFLGSEQPLPPAQARNRGIAASSGEILAFLDADCVPGPDWLVHLMAPFSSPEVHVVGGSMAPDGPGFWTLADNVSTFHEYLSTLGPGTREQLPTFNLSCRRSVLHEIGGFDEAYPYPAGEDADLTVRARLAGYQLHFQPAAAVRHYPSRGNPSALLRHAYRLGRYSIKVDPRYADRLGVPWILRRAWRVILAAPVLAAGVTWRAFRQDRSLRRLWYLAPVVLAAKLAWCLGAARTLHQGAPIVAPWGTIPRLGSEP